METEPLEGTGHTAGASERTPVSSETRPPRKPILPEIVRHPFALVWVAIVPQLILLLLNLRDYLLVAGEMTPWQRRMSATIAGVELLLLIGAVAMTLMWRSRRRPLPWLACGALLIASVLYLWFFLYQIENVIPTSVTVWILPTEWVVYDQFVFIMPLIFYSLVRLACIDLNISRALDFGMGIAILICAPLVIYGASRIPYRWHSTDHISDYVLWTIFVALTVAMLCAALRLLVIGYLAVSRKGPIALGILTLLVGIAGPIGGLLLNRRIPFPNDFQATSVYAMAALNGLLLLLPNFRSIFLHRLTWLAQCALFPFTLYFFLVFLPFLLLAVPAILAVGAGFLILTPTALFLVHGQRLLDGYRNEIRDTGRLKPALLGLVALSVIPSIYVAEAIFDRFTLRSAIGYVYTPNYQADTRFHSNTVFVRRALEHLRDSKAGLDLPFLSRFYNWVVFDGLVLPDDKMNHIHRAFFGRDFPAQERSGAFGAPRSRQTFRPSTVAPAQNVTLVRTTATVQPEGSCRRATVVLDLQNNSAQQSEFVSPIQVPDGVLVSGFWLHIGKERVPGQLFEQKTAMWVYQMIRDRSRRDPGLLIYKDPGTLELRVFPFADHEQRQLEIEFLYPASLQPTVHIGDQIVQPSGAAQSSGIVETRSTDGYAGLWVSSTAMSSMPHVMRTPYLHFIVDRSANSDVTPEKLNQIIAAARASFPSARKYKVTAANYEVADLTTDLAALDSPVALDFQMLPRRGGFLPEREMKRELLSYRDELSAVENAASPILTEFPVFIVVSGSGSEQSALPDISAFGKFTPDIAGCYATHDPTGFESHEFSGSKTQTPHSFQPVTLFRIDKEVVASASSVDSGTMIHFNGTGRSGPATVFDPATKTFVAVAKADTVPSDTRYAAGVAAWEEYLESIYNPSLQNKLAEVVKRSRESGILVGGTAYIVVENSAQWNMLARKQKQKLRNNATLEFEAVPEPSTWLLIISGTGLLLFFVRRQRSV